MEKEDYKPTREEVLAEVVRPTKEAGKKAGKYLKQSLMGSLVAYIIPTALRKTPNHKGTNLEVALDAFQIITYSQLAMKGIPAYLIPIATNVLSGIYEAGRFIYKNAEEKLINKNKSLEGKLNYGDKK